MTLRIFIDRENQTIEFQCGDDPFAAEWLPGMPGDGGIYRDEDGRVVGGFFPLPFRDVAITDTGERDG